MAFDLEVAINGLSVFVADPTGKQMHVLMVAPASHHNHPAVRHYPRVFYEAVHSGYAAPGYWHAVPLEDTVLDLSGFSGNGILGSKVDDIPGLVDIRPYLKKPVKNPIATDTKRPPNLAARLTLPLADAIDAPKPREDWELKQQGQASKPSPKAAWQVVWKIQGIARPELDWQLVPFTRKLSERPFPRLPVAPLRPVQDGGRQVVRIFVSNNVREESGPPDKNVDPPKTNFTMPHFEHFQDLYTASALKKPWPKLVYKGPPGAQKGTQYTCLSSGGK